jgi:hypothetical protein
MKKKTDAGATFGAGKTVQNEEQKNDKLEVLCFVSCFYPNRHLVRRSSANIPFLQERVIIKKKD